MVYYFILKNSGFWNVFTVFMKVLLFVKHLFDGSTDRTTETEVDIIRYLCRHFNHPVQMTEVQHTVNWPPLECEIRMKGF